MRKRKKLLFVVLTCLMIFACGAITVFAADGGKEYVPKMYSSFWALVPPIVAIGLALITKEVYSSLFVGIAIGGIFWSNFHFEKAVLHIFEDGIVGVLTDSYNMGILVFLVILGIMVCMMNNAGGSAAFGRWASIHIKTRVGAQLATIVLGILIFIDDYFNCLTVGSVMRPITDKHNVSRAKLAYLIDATAAPVCIIAPISSWAAAVTGFVKGEDGFSIFMRAIPYNYYALLTILAMVLIVVLKIDYGPMKLHEDNAVKGDIYTTPDRPYANAENEIVEEKGKVIDLVIDGAAVHKTLMIVTDKLDPVKDVIIKDINRGATLLPAVGMYRGESRNMIYTILTRREMMILRHRIAEIDPEAFINVIDSKEILGRGFKPLKES